MYYTHFIFNTYQNKHSLLDLEFKEFLAASFQDIAKKNNLNILACNILADHVHLLIEHPFMEYGKIMKYIKGASARSFFQKLPSNRLVDRKLWGRSYHYRKIEPVDIDHIKDYIENQTKAGYDKRYV